MKRRQDSELKLQRQDEWWPAQSLSGPIAEKSHRPASISFRNSQGLSALR